MTAHTQQKHLNTKINTEMSFLVVGLVRNCAAHLKTDIARLQSALGSFKNIYWLLIESDSTDTTLSVLEEITQQIDNFSFISLGNLRQDIILRTERIAYCRNIYMEELATNLIYKDLDYVIVADFDGLNTHITEEAILSCWERDDWDVCTANQLGPYYDIWALRHKDWCANDCWEQYKFLCQFNDNPEKMLDIAVNSKMITIPAESDWIKVESAFGGLAIYKRNAIELARYNGLTEEGKEICEHLFFHQTLRQNNYSIFINPKLINAAYTEHTEHLLFRKKIIRKIKRLLRLG